MLVFNEICFANKTSLNSKLFLYKRKGKIGSCDLYENLSPLNNRINLVLLIVSNMYFNLMHFRSKTTFTSMDTNIKFS